MTTPALYHEFMIYPSTEQGWSFLHRYGNFGTLEEYVFQADVAVVISDQAAKHLKSGLLHTLARYYLHLG